MTRTYALLSTAALIAGIGMTMLTVQSVATSDGSSVLQLARHGADDKPGDDRGGGRGGKGADDPAGHASLAVDAIYQVARHGADDKPGDNRGGKGADDGANHA